MKVKEQIAKEMRAFKRGVFLAVLVAVAPKRADGWPLCPFCGQDELFSIHHDLATPSTIVGCYRCNWRLP